MADYSATSLDSIFPFARRSRRSEYLRKVREARRDEPSEPVVSYREYLRMLDLRRRLAVSDPGGDLRL